MEQKLLVRGKEKLLEMWDVFDGTTPEQAIDYIVAMSNDLDGEQHKFYVERDPYGEDSDTVVLVSYRYETDKEYERRLKVEENAKVHKEKLKVKKEESERKEYERLAKKYGSQNK